MYRFNHRLAAGHMPSENMRDPQVTVPKELPAERFEVRELPGLLNGRDDTHAHVEALLDPFALIVSLWIAAFSFDDPGGSHYLILSLVVGMLTFPGKSRLHVTFGRLVSDIIFLSVTLIGLLIFFGWATRHLSLFADRAIVNWFWLAPTCLITAHGLFRYAAPLVLRRQQRCVIVGINDQGVALARRIQQNPYTDLSLAGFFDDRAVARTVQGTSYPVLGQFTELAAYVKQHHIHVIYLSLPMATQQRTMSLLAQLQDTTASIYFVPDQFVTELIQCRMSSVVDIPVVSVCETPFVGLNGVLKRASDIVISSVALLLLSPVLLLIALLVRISSDGPILFRQRRYGLDGEEIIVYKFRSMRVEEDGNKVVQAQRNDPRVTPIGAILRRSSLDELPQLINVLQGRMSLVGPRPHAVAHNELYRQVITGYMLRHKVRPGITGWAQVNGLRGETDTLDKMEARVKYDLDYLRNWSLRLDVHILIKTVATVLGDRHAY
jgi:putative colanic acid biosynthesis UDP-glucose lipid carrier transferase